MVLVHGITRHGSLFVFSKDVNVTACFRMVLHVTDVAILDAAQLLVRVAAWLWLKLASCSAPELFAQSESSVVPGLLRRAAHQGRAIDVPPVPLSKRVAWIGCQGTSACRRHESPPSVRTIKPPKRIHVKKILKKIFAIYMDWQAIIKVLYLYIFTIRLYKYMACCCRACRVGCSIVVNDTISSARRIWWRSWCGMKANVGVT